MSKIIEKAPKILAYLLVILSGIFVAMIYVGGNAESLEVGGELLTVPKYTDTLLYWSYFLIGLIVVITLLLIVLGFVKSLVANPLSAIKSLIPLIIFVLIFVVAWSLGSAEKISIIGYEGTENEGFWAQFTDMVIYASYTLFAAVVLAIFGARVYTSLK
ncbi:MAG: hypothetical protein PHR62_08790 [Paludibacter sp.]|jgi:hypothetical protein|nr:hypothetical protein [Paludibacter sp.]MDD3489966.1 hypothetical protein [Paludibacter sp.]